MPEDDAPDFTYAAPEEPPTKPVSFDLHGERFTCFPDMPGISWMRYAAQLNKGAVVALETVEEFFREIMESSEFERFLKFASDQANHVSVATLGNLFNDLFVRYGGGESESSRPTKPSGPSQPGRSETEATSSDDSSSEASG